MKRSDYYTISAIIIIIGFALSGSMASLYENYLEGRIIYNAIGYNSSVMIGNNTCFTSIYDDTINFTCNGTIQGLQNITLNGNTYISSLTIGSLEYNKSYCSIFFPYNESTSTITITQSEVYYNFTMLDNSSCAGMTVNHTTYDKIIVDKTGEYTVSFSVSFTGGNTGLYGIGIAKNGIIQRNCYSQQTASGSVQNTGVTCYLQLDKNDIIDLQVDDEQAPSQNIVIHTAQLSTHRIGSKW